MADSSLVALAGLGIVLGLRHGIDWDHIAAITDITSSTVTTEEPSRAENTVAAARPPAEAMRFATRASFGGMQLADGLGSGRSAAPLTVAAPRQRQREMRDGFFLATLYALGHATLVIALGLVAIWASALLPDWIDPLMERVVGITLLVLGIWIIYSLVRYGRSFRLQSRWMVVFSLARRGWAAAKSKLTGRPVEHAHDFAQYGPRTAFGIGMIHGVGAETGSQAVLLASVAGATTQASGSVLLLFFAIGLLLSNSLVAAFSAFGFVSASTKRNLYVVVGVIAAVFSLIVGTLFVTGQGAALPDLEQVLNRLFGEIGAGE